MQGVGALLIRLSRYIRFLVDDMSVFVYCHCLPICAVNSLLLHLCIFILELRFNVQISPDFRQAAGLKKMVEDKIAKGKSFTSSCTMHHF